MIEDNCEAVTIAEHVTNGCTFSFYRHVAILSEEVAEYVLLRLQEKAPERDFVLSSIRHYRGCDDAAIADDILSAEPR